MTDHHAHDQPRWSESARQVWLAGVGAWTRAQAEGSRVFDGLVRDGENAGRQGEDARGGAAGPWDRLGQFVEDALQKAMLKLGVARREDIEALGRQVQALSAQLAEARAREDAPRTDATATPPAPPAP